MESLAAAWKDMQRLLWEASMGTRNPDPVLSYEHRVNHRAGFKPGPPLALLLLTPPEERRMRC